MAYSVDLRKRAVAAVIEKGRNQEEVADTFDIGLATLSRWLKQQREKGHLIPTSPPGPQAKVTPTLYPQVRKLVKDHPDATLAEYCQLLEESTDIKIGVSAMWRTFSRLKITRKKKTYINPKRDEGQRWSWVAASKKLDPKKFIFVDESATWLDMKREYARSELGERAYVGTDQRTGKHYSLLASLSLEGVTTSLLVDGTTTGEVFETYIKECLAPSLREGQIVIMDNSKVHLGAKVKEEIEARGGKLMYLPTYSPDLSPIENSFSKIKDILRKLGGKCLKSLSGAVKIAINSITLKDLRGWFNLCGYTHHFI